MTKENSGIKKYDDMILGKNVISTFNSQVTGLNNNTVVLGATGSGKTFSVTIPQLMHTYNNSLVVTLTKRKVADEYKDLMQSRGYYVDILDEISINVWNKDLKKWNI